MAEKEQSKKKKKSESGPPPTPKRRHNPARTEANKLRRIARNAAQKSGKLPKHKRERYRRRAGLPIRYERIAAL